MKRLRSIFQFFKKNSIFSSLYAFKYVYILVPRGGAPFGQHQESRPLGGSNFRSTRKVIVSYSQPVRFVTVDPEHAQSDGESMNCGLPVLELLRGRDSWC